MVKTKIGDVAIEFINEENGFIIGYNEFGLLADVFGEALKRGVIKEVGSRGGRLQPHPLNRQMVVLNALDRDERFRKFHIICCGSGAERRVREFELIQKGGLKD